MAMEYNSTTYHQPQRLEGETQEEYKSRRANSNGYANRTKLKGFQITKGKNIPGQKPQWIRILKDLGAN